MNKKRIRIFCFISTVVLLTATLASPVYAKDHSARLKDCLQSEYIYYATSIYNLNYEMYYNKAGFKKDFDNRCVVIYEDVKVESVSSYGYEMTVSDAAGNKCKINTSSPNVKAVAERLSNGNKVTVYGKITVTGLRSDSYEIIARNIVLGEKSFSAGSYVYDYEYVFDGVPEESITTSGNVTFSIPQSWMSDYSRAKLTNNGIKGFQYYLNSVEPLNMDYPEVFSIFYFNNETYLEKVPTNPTDGDNKDIEEAIVRNILQDLEGSFKIKMESFKDINGEKIDYYSTSYRPKDGHDYRLEFLFKPGKKGIVCMLYLYFPTEAAVNHVREAAYLVENLKFEE